MAPLPSAVDVLVVGAGPTGLTLAAALHRTGASVAVIDRGVGIRHESRAVGLQPHTLESLESIDVTGQIVDEGLHGTGFRAYSPTERLISVPYDGLPTRYPFIVLLPQDRTEEILAARVEADGIPLLRGHRLVDVSDAGDAVEALVAGPDGSVGAVRARFVAGADGVHSRVRDLAGIGFEGTDRPGSFALADVRVASWPGDPHVAFVFSASGLLVASPMAGDVVRLVANAPDDMGVPDMDDVRGLLDGRGSAALPLEVSEIVNASAYRVSSRLTTAFSSGRLVLAGDAAHVHSPAGGQGMNMGMQDALALARHLSTALGDRALATSELADYEAERRPIAAGVLDFTGQITGLALLGDSPLAAVRDQLLRTADGMPAATGALAHRMSQIPA
jgi:2-polyprenyl-6-methoxyphenol hydroxylase-like FAD-dependent oxidoreductase